MNKAFEKIINRFKQLKGCDSLANMFISDVIKVIKSIEKEYNNGWIPCSERLPEKNTNVIVCFSHGLVTEMRYEGNGIFQDIYEYSADVIRAWQPLPESYREEQEDE